MNVVYYTGYTGMTARHRMFHWQYVHIFLRLFRDVLSSVKYM